MPSNLLFRVQAAKPNKTFEKINKTGWVKLSIMPSVSLWALEMTPAETLI